MNSLTLLLLPLLFLNFAFAQTDIATEKEKYEQRYGTENDEFEFEKFDNETILLAIKKDMDIACNKQGLCTLSAVTSNDNRFTIQLNIGQGYNMGGVSGGSGTTVIVPGASGQTYSSEPYYGVSVRYTISKCTQMIKVPRSLYISLNRYMYGLISEEGGTRRGFTPADEAMIMFYSTIMKQATGCVAGQ
jgi:hypothetical protein